MPSLVTATKTKNPQTTAMPHKLTWIFRLLITVWTTCSTRSRETVCRADFAPVRHKNLVSILPTMTPCYLAFTEGGPSLQMQRLFSFWGGRGRDGDWLDQFTWPFRHILGRLTWSNAHCHCRREQKVFACAFIASLVLSQLWTTHIACKCTCQMWEMMARFCLRWFSSLCTWGHCILAKCQSCYWIKVKENHCIPAKSPALCGSLPHWS